MENDWTTARADYEAVIEQLKEVEAKLRRHIDWLHAELRMAEKWRDNYKAAFEKSRKLNEYPHEY